MAAGKSQRRQRLRSGVGIFTWYSIIISHFISSGYLETTQTQLMADGGTYVIQVFSILLNIRTQVGLLYLYAFVDKYPRTTYCMNIIIREPCAYMRVSSYSNADANKRIWLIQE